MRNRTCLKPLPIALLAVACVASVGCRSEEVKFKWQRQTWKANFEYGVLGGDPGNPVSVTSPDGSRLQLDELPFKIIHPSDGAYQAVPFSTPGTGISATTPRHVYILDIYGQDQVLVFNQDPASYVAAIAVPEFPQGMALSRDGAFLYLTHNQNAPAPGRLSIINTATRSIVQTISLPAGIDVRKPVLSPDDRFLYIPNQGRFQSPQGYLDAGVIVVDTQTRTIAATIPLNAGPGATISRLAITPDGALLYAIPTQFSPNRLFVIDTATREVTANILLGLPSLRDILVNYTGTRLYLLSESAVTVYDTGSLTRLTQIPVSGNPRFNNFALSIDGGSLFVNHEFERRFTRIDTSTHQIVEQINTGQREISGSFLLAVP